MPSRSFRNVLVLSTLIRILLILYSEYHDARSPTGPKYTDIDYKVFTDAAKYVLHPEDGNRAQGPLNLNVGDPYTRQTYRYTPLLAVLLTPNEFLHPSFGKYLFAACDLVAGWLIWVILKKRRQTQATVCSALHLLNPLVFSISTRGSSESILALFVLSTLYAATEERWDFAAVMLGVSTHWKIYPWVYGVGCLGIIGGPSEGFLKSLVNARTIRFGVISVGAFGALSLACYLIWGQPFLEHSYIYHLHRLDHRHNFSPYFYLTYLTYPTQDPEQLSFRRVVLRSPLTSFVPQIFLTLGTGLMLGRRKQDLVLTWFVQTFVFVIFNKVCTSQYFLWYILLLPLLIPQLNLTIAHAVTLLAVWIGTQAIWLAEAYKLEFLGQNVFFGLWIRSCIYVVGHSVVLGEIIRAYRRE